MTEPLDVSLRVKLAYEAAGGAKAAVADIEAIRAGAQRLGSQQGILQSARHLADLGKGAAVAKASLDDLAQAGSRLSAASGGSARLSSAVAGIARPAADARRELAGVSTAAAGLGRAVGAISGDGLSTLSTEAVAARRAIADTAAAAGRLAAAPAPAAMTAGMEQAAKAAGDLDRQIDALLASGAELNAWSPAQAQAAMQAFEAQIKSGRGEVGALEKAADKLGGAGPARLAESVAAVTPAATEARRHIDDVATAARTAERDMERMGRTASASGGGGGEHGGGAGVAAGGGHGGPGGLRGAAIAAARPLHMERLVMSAFTPIGAAGLAGGLGVAAIGREIKDATDQAIAFEAAMVEVRRAAGNMPAEGVKRLESTILDVSRATGTSKEDLAGMAAAATRAGRPVADLPRFLELGAKAANVMGLKVGEAGDKLVQLGRTWGKDEAGIEDTSDAIALASERTGARAGGVLDFTNRFSNLRERGMSARQVAAFGAGFQGAGLDPSQAEGTFGDFSEKLANPQKAGQPFEADLARLGVGPSQARVGMRTDPTRQMVDVLDRLKALPDMQRVPMLERMFGPEGGRDIGRVVDHLDGLKRTLGLVEDQAERHGALERSFKIFDDTTRAKLDKMSASAAKLAVDIGKLFAPAVGNSADAMARAFDAGSKYLELSGEAKAILDRQGEGKAPTPEQQADLDKHPTLRAYVGQDRDPAGTAAKRESDRLKALGTIQDLDRSARENGNDPQIRGMADEARKDYRSTYPERPKDEELRAAPDKHASLVDPSMIHRASFTDGDERPAGRGGATDALREVMAAATKQGVVEGMREFMELRGGAGGSGGSVLNASYETGDLGASSDGGGAVHRGGSGAPNMRYGRAPRAAALPNMRYGRAGGGGYRDTPGAVARGPHGHASGGYRHTPGRAGSLGANSDESAQPSGGGSGSDWAAAILRPKEKFAAHSYWDVNHERVGYGSDTITRADGSVHEVHRGDTVTKEEAERDLKRRVGEFGGRLRKEVGAANWDRLDPATRGALTSVGYNYGSFAKLPGLRSAIASGDKGRIASAVRGLQGHNNGVNRQRRLEEASVIETGHLPPSWHARDPSATAVANGEDRATRARRADASSAEPHSPRFTDPRMKTPARSAGGGASRPAGAGAAPAAVGPAPVQNFYGNHDPAQTARMAMMEQNREVRRSQARALHSVGRTA
ncbi:phage tail tape measure protein [Lichenibacterium ramalinae]|uniref:Lysozyme n=1 Tax=Lichenibacterium ramalinae TaxID=2316527 RepID=A0A4Q2R8E7_9HYPH|nr:phage tail tape measure protein [Lichenibacterium ramalinae]RYB02033.1 phage tail tape measure protein [Lichenibacterium ramalinae]